MRRSDVTDDIRDDVFHSCALLAFVEVATECGGWPDSEAVKKRAYRYYEEALREKNAGEGEDKVLGQPGTRMK
jgi:hypothetical protein